MALRIVRLGTPRLQGEGTRIGTVRRPPRGVAKERYAIEDWFDIWYPDLAPSLRLMSRAKSVATASAWNIFARSFKAEMNAPVPRRTLDLLALLSHDADFSIGCYCADETRCHRLILRALLADRRATIL
jgi:uncharacterized protein YeaO (DUF488 family)